jgi:uncharacterized membrane protein
MKISARTLTRGIFRIFPAILLGLSAGQVQFAQTVPPVVRAVLFSSPTCPHCGRVREEVLPPLAARYGSQLQVAIVSTATPAGYELFLSACMRYGLIHLSVPLLIVGNTPLVGDEEIPLRFPDLIEKHLAAGGVDWPGIPGLAAMLASSPAFSVHVPQRAGPAAPSEETSAAVPAPVATNATPAAKPEPGVKKELPAPSAIGASSASPPLSSRKLEHAAPGLAGSARGNTPRPSIPPRPKEFTNTGASTASRAAATGPSGIIDLTGGSKQAGIVERIRHDIYGNSLAILTLTGMLLTLLLSPIIIRRIALNPARVPDHDWVTPILTVAGLGVAAYLSHVELRKVTAVCGPVGDCNTVQQSEYARLFGVLPIGVLGLAGFLAILIAWMLRRWGSGRIPLWASLGILSMTGFGTLFSVYLTFLEPFVIGATCLWCLSSALIMTMLYVLALRPGRQAWSALARLDRRFSPHS